MGDTKLDSRIANAILVSEKMLTNEKMESVCCKEMKKPTEPKFVICHNGKDVYHYSKVESDQEIITGQPFMEVFDTEEEALKVYGEKIAIYLPSEQIALEEKVISEQEQTIKQ